MGIKVQFNSSSNKIDVGLKTQKTSSNVDSSGAVFLKGEDGTTFIPQVSDEGVLSWTNDKSLENPKSVNIKGTPGEPGKSAYDYAKEAGYAGTEEEFAEKLASDNPGGGTASNVPDDEMLELFAEMDVVQPLANANNNVFTDVNNKIYVL